MNIKTAITEKVKAYYLKGLNYKEIGKLLDLSPRSVQRYAKGRRMSEDDRAEKPATPCAGDARQRLELCRDRQTAES